VLTKAQFDARYPPEDATAPYVLQVSSDVFIDSACHRGIGAYANGSKSGYKPNAFFSVHPGSRSAKLVSNKRIRAGDEILLSYGRSYWKKSSASFSTDPAPSWEWTVFPPASFVPGGAPASDPFDVFAFADDLASASGSVPAIYPALRKMDAYSDASGLGINKDKSCMVCTGDPTTYDDVIASLGPCPASPS